MTDPTSDDEGPDPAGTTQDDPVGGTDSGTVIVAPILTRLVRIEVDKLFDLYNHRVTMRTADRITIFHGPNGIGKTILLRMIAALFSGDYLEFGEFPFNQLRLFFVDGAIVKISQKRTPQNHFC